MPDDLGYTGHEYDAETGLTYMQARYQDPIGGRFYGIDPVGFDPNQPMTFNRYSYANNNPYKFVDPDGKNADDLGFPSHSESQAIAVMNARAAMQKEVGYQSRQVVLNTIAAGSALLILTPAAPVAGPVSAAASTIALVDKASHEGVTTQDVIVAAVTMAPAAKLLKTASPVAAEIVKVDQAVLAAGTAAVSAAAAAAEKPKNENRQEQKPKEKILE